MRTLRNGAALRDLSTLFRAGTTGALTDGQLLERYATGDAEAAAEAFAALVERHGPRILRLCRSVVGDEHGAHDAFQATFLVLVQRGRSLWVRDSLSPWLMAVAYRVACCARSSSVRRRRHERRLAEIAAARPYIEEDLDRRDREAVLYEELDRLPEHYRTPLVLCDLEGCTHEQAARHLGWPVGTVKSRQARGRQRLRVRLIRRGLSPTAGIMLAACSAAKAEATGVPAALAQSTAELATIEAGVDSARVIVLAKEVLTVMFLQKLKWIAAPLLAVALGALGAGSLPWQANAAMPEEGQAPGDATQRPQATPAAAKQEAQGKIYLTTERPTPLSSVLIRTLVAVDPATGVAKDLFAIRAIRPRISPDGLSVAYERDDSLWVRRLAEDAEPRKIIDLGTSSKGSPPVWSPDGKQIVISLGRDTEPGKNWVFSALRVNSDGSDQEKLPIPREDCIQDWSSDGRWLLTASGRGVKDGWQLYVMQPDGTHEQRLTEKGNPFYARFSPDSRRVLYTANALGDQSGIWVVDVDGKNRRRVFPIGSQAQGSACWSLDGKRIAVVLDESQAMGRQGARALRLIVMDLDGNHRTEVPIPAWAGTDMPDWR